MKKAICMGLVLAAALSLPQLASAQLKGMGDRVIKGAKNSAERRAEQNINRKVDKTVDDAFRGNSNKKKKKGKKEAKKEAEKRDSEKSSETRTSTNNSENTNRTGSAANNSRGETAPAAAPSPSALKSSPFIGSYSMEVKEMKNGKLAKDGHNKMSYSIKDYSMAVTIEDLAKKKIIASTIIHRKDKLMAVKDHETKKATLLPFNGVPDIGKTSKEEKAPTIKRTEELKMIDGKPCVKYLGESDTETMTYWVDEAVDAEKLWQAMILGAGSPKGQLADLEKRTAGIKGLPREMQTVSKKNPKDIVNVRVTEFEQGKIDNDAFGLQGFEVQDLSNY